MLAWDNNTKILAAAIGGILMVATIVGASLSLVATGPGARRTVDNLNARTRAWWVMVILFALALAAGKGGVVVLFALCSFQALREMITLAPSRRADHHTLFWAFFVIVPLHYYLLYIDWYGMFAIFIPVYCFLFLAIRSTLTGDSARYLERMHAVTSFRVFT